MFKMAEEKVEDLKMGEEETTKGLKMVVEEKEEKVKSFKDLRVCDELVEAANSVDWTKPSKISEEAIPHALEALEQSLIPQETRQSLLQLEMQNSLQESSSDEHSDSKHANLTDDHARNSCSTSPVPGEDSEHQLADTGESSSPQNIDGYAEVGLVRADSQSYTPTKLQQQVPSALPSFSDAITPLSEA